MRKINKDIVDTFIVCFSIVVLFCGGNLFATYVTEQNKLNNKIDIENNTIDISRIKYIYIKDKKHLIKGDTLVL